MLRRLKVIVKGSAMHIVAEIAGNKCRVEEALIELRRTSPDSESRIAAILERIANHDTSDLDPSLYKPIRDGLHEIREKRGLFRILAFRDPQRNRLIVLIRAFEKNPGKGSGSKQQDEQIRLALKYKKEYERTEFLIVEE